MDNLNGIDNLTKELAVDLILTNLLGGKRKMEELDFVDIVNIFENQKDINPLKYLPAQMERVKTTHNHGYGDYIMPNII